MRGGNYVMAMHDIFAKARRGGEQGGVAPEHILPLLPCGRARRVASKNTSAAGSIQNIGRLLPSGAGASATSASPRPL